MITPERAERALKYLASTDEDHAKAKANVKAKEMAIKTIKAAELLEVEGKTAGEREARAECHSNVKQAKDDYSDAILDYELLNNERNRAVLTIEMWRSMNASLKRGNI